MVLFNAYPRHNTNPVAHALLERFWSFKEIITADVSELTEIEGVGEQVALYLNLLGKYFYSKSADNAPMLFNFAGLEQFIKTRFCGKDKEYLEIYFVDAKGKLRRLYSYFSNSADHVAVDERNIAARIAKLKPYGVIAAHNHLIGGNSPSECDDDFSVHLLNICASFGAKFLDHCIYSDEGVYSYFMSERLREVRATLAADRELQQKWTNLK